MKLPTTQDRIQAFETKFGLPHLYLAYHAALPLAITPDLLYRIWANFQTDIHNVPLNIPWIAVADLILSSLCDEVGREVFEIDATLRQELLNQLKQDPRFTEKRLKQVAGLLLAYVRQDLISSDFYHRDFAESQSWTALAYLNPKESAHLLAAEFERAYREDPEDLVRLASLTEMLHQNLPEFEKLLIFARAMGHYQRQNLEKAQKEVLQLNIQGNRFDLGNDITVKVPEDLLKYQVLLKYKNTSVYSLCTDQPWRLSFDGFVIPTGTYLSLTGSLATNFFDSLEDSTLVNIISNKARERQNPQSPEPYLTAEMPLFVPLTPEFQEKLPQIDIANTEAFLIFATLEDVSGNPKVFNAFQAMQAILHKLNETSSRHLVIPLLGTGNNYQPVSSISIAMLSAIKDYLDKYPNNKIEKIIFIDRNSATISSLNGVANKLFNKIYSPGIELLSTFGIDYETLKSLLENKQWQKADEETARCMLKIANREKEGFLRIEDIDNFPHLDLKTINQLWLTYSQGHFGFSVQKKIYQFLARDQNFSQGLIDKFGEQVGWKLNNQPWLKYGTINYREPPLGHLPIRYDSETLLEPMAVILRLITRPDIVIPEDLRLPGLDNIGMSEPDNEVAQESELVSLGRTWEEVADRLESPEFSRDRQRIKEQIDVLLGKIKTNDQKQELYKQLQNYLVQRRIELQEDGGQDSGKYKQEREIIDEIIKQYKNEETIIFCTNCGTKNTANSKFCYNCGTRLADS